VGVTNGVHESIEAPESSFDFHDGGGDLLGTGHVSFDYLANVT